MTAFDYIVVGAGSAGCVLAHRLSADPDISVLLLEAGGDDRNWRIQMPAAMSHAFTGTRFSWAYETEPEPHLNGRRIDHPRGRVLGGSSAINGLMYMRGHARDYDRWAQAGCRGWSYADVLPYFCRSETFDRGADDYHGGDGPLRITSAEMANPLCHAFLEAGVQAGYPRSGDLNGHQQEGFGPTDRTTYAGRRWSTASAYLRPVLGRPNLTVRTGVLARRVVLENGRAVGVAYVRGGAETIARAEREVILAGGAINSPQLLLLAGIGPADDLRAHGVEVAADLPGVGGNLHDHPDIAVKQACTLPVSLHDDMRWLGRVLIGVRWFLLHDGLGASNQFEAGAFIRSRAGIEHPDLQITIMPMAVAAEAGMWGPQHRPARLHDPRRHHAPDQPRPAMAALGRSGRAAAHGDQLHANTRGYRRAGRRRQADPRGPRPSRPSTASAARSCRPARRCATTPRSSPGCAPTWAPAITPWAPARWAATPTRLPWSMTVAGCTVSRACG